MLLCRCFNIQNKKIPQPVREDMTMLAESFNSFKIDTANCFKPYWVTNSLDGREDYLVQEKIIALVDSHLKE